MRQNHPRKGERLVPDVMVWVTKPGDEAVQELATLGEEIRRLEHVSEVDVRTEGRYWRSWPGRARGFG